MAKESQHKTPTRTNLLARESIFIYSTSVETTQTNLIIFLFSLFFSFVLPLLRRPHMKDDVSQRNDDETNNKI